jgi:hypothetical protein
MSDTLTTVNDYLHDIKQYVSEKGNDIVSEIDSALDELETYRDLFDDEYDARDCKDYMEEMKDIFEDTYEAQKAYDFLSSAEYAGLDDEDLEAVASELEMYRALGDIDEVREAVESSDGGVRVADLEKELAEAREKLEAFENSRLVALNVLDGVPVEQVNETVEGVKLEAAQELVVREQQAYDAGIMDAEMRKIGDVIRSEVHPEVDINLDGGEDSE